MDYLKISPLKHVPLEIEWDPNDLDSSDIMKRLGYGSETKSCSIQERVQYSNVNKNG